MAERRAAPPAEATKETTDPTVRAPLLTMQEVHDEYTPMISVPRLYQLAQTDQLPVVRLGRRVFVSREGMDKLVRGGGG